MSGWMFLLVPAHPGTPGQRAIKRSCVCVWVLRQKFVVAPTTSDIVGDIRSTSANVGAEYRLQPSELQDFVSTEHGDLGGEVLPAADVDTLSQAIEKERLAVPLYHL